MSCVRILALVALSGLVDTAIAVSPPATTRDERMAAALKDYETQKSPAATSHRATTSSGHQRHASGRPVATPRAHAQGKS